MGVEPITYRNGLKARPCAAASNGLDAFIGTFGSG
jgi:hypothetical protein